MTQMILKRAIVDEDAIEEDDDEVSKVWSKIMVMVTWNDDSALHGLNGITLNS